MASELQLSSKGALHPEGDQEGGLRLDRFVAALRRHLLLIAGITTLTASAAVLKAITDAPTYQSSFDILTPSSTLETQIISTLNPNALSNQTEFGNSTIDETRLRILTSPRVIEPILKELQKSQPSVSYGQLITNLKIVPNQDGEILTVTYSSEDPEQVTDVLEVVMAGYLRYSLEDRQNDIFRGLDFLDEQLPEVRERVSSLEAELEDLRQRSNLIDPLKQGEQLSTQTAKFTAEQFDLRLQLEQSQQLYQELQQTLNNDGELAANSALLNSNRYQALLNQLLEVDSQLAADLTLYLENSPEIEVVESRRENLQPLIEREGLRVQRELASYIRELENRDRALSETIVTLNQTTNRLSTVTRQYNALQRELEIATTNLNQFLTKREALRIDAAQRQTPWEVLTPPSQPRASAASAKRNLLLGTLLGLLLGAGAAIVVDRFSGKIYTIDELKAAVRLPVLGNIPISSLLNSGGSVLFAVREINSIGLTSDFSLPPLSYELRTDQVAMPFLEAFRILATNIRLSNPEQPLKSITVSSAVPNSGKTTVSFHLAYTMALLGYRTLVVDNDFRRPSLHTLCHLPNEKGLSNYVIGEYDFEDIVVNLPLDEKLFIVTAGPIPPSPLKILAAPRMQEFYDKINQEFDFIIFDTPPLLGFADTPMIAEKTQGMLLAVHLGEVKYSQLQAALDELQIAQTSVIGMVANYSQEQIDSGYGYYHYYHQSTPVNGKSNHKTAWTKKDKVSSLANSFFSFLSK
ncbi:capsular biosynthesis protein [filamentous cyanobacterium CCT1]|nr:capsular biosynthesis protein [filamentous cyanobacterium CCT1]PSN81593.1 capsular biosynthesis protein [filamentous cyanobacterium CCP4]